MGRHMSALAAWPGLARRDRGFWRRRAISRQRPRTLCDYTGRTRAKPEQSDPSVPSPSGDGLSFVYQGRGGYGGRNAGRDGLRDLHGVA